MFNTHSINQTNREEECRVFGHIWSLTRTDQPTPYRVCHRCHTHTTD